MSTDQYAREHAFSTPISGVSWGARMLARVSPSPDGALVHVSGATRVRANSMANPQERNIIIRLLDEVGRQLQAMLQQDPSGATPLTQNSLPE